MLGKVLKRQDMGVVERHSRRYFRRGPAGDLQADRKYEGEVASRVFITSPEFRRVPDSHFILEWRSSLAVSSLQHLYIHPQHTKASYNKTCLASICFRKGTPMFPSETAGVEPAPTHPTPLNLVPVWVIMVYFRHASRS